MKNFYKEKMLICFSAAFFFSWGLPANARITNCYEILGLDRLTGESFSSAQKDYLQQVSIQDDLVNITSMECFIHVANVIGTQNHKLLKPFWDRQVHVAPQSKYFFLLSESQVNERGLDFFRHPYYQKSSAIGGVIASCIFKHFLPCAPEAFLVFSEDGEEKTILGLATEPVKMASLLDYDIAAYNKKVASDTSMDQVALSFKNVEEWYALAKYLLIPTFNMADIGITNATQEVVSIGYSGAFQGASHDIEAESCLTSNHMFTLHYACNQTRVEEMEKRIQAEKETIKNIVDDAFSAFQAVLTPDDLSGYKNWIYRNLGF